MSNSYKSIKDTLNQTKKALLKDKKYKEANQSYLEKLNEIYGDNVIDLSDTISDHQKNNMSQEINILLNYLLSSLGSI